jgi:hypothetical protein
MCRVSDLHRVTFNSNWLSSPQGSWVMGPNGNQPLGIGQSMVQWPRGSRWLRWRRRSRKCVSSATVPFCSRALGLAHPMDTVSFSFVDIHVITPYDDHLTATIVTGCGYELLSGICEVRSSFCLACAQFLMVSPPDGRSRGDEYVTPSLSSGTMV